jgi:RNA polymerase sigma factor (sigma-70 family)
MRCWTDEEICRGVGDPAQRQAAFRALHERHGPRLLGFLARMCRGDRDLAEDLLGRALYKAFVGLARRGPRDRPLRSLSAWLYTVAARTALDALERGTAGDPLHGALPLNEEVVEGVAAPEASGTGEWSRVDQAVERVLERLDAENPRYRTLIEMEHVGACDRGEIADATGIPRKQIAQYLKRARERFLQLAREEPALAALEGKDVPGMRDEG